MDKREFRMRLRGVGKTLKVVSEEEGISLKNMYNWVRVPRWAEWYLRYHEERQRNLDK